MDKADRNQSLQLLMLITTPKLADKAADMFRKGSLPLQYRIQAQGTATSEIMDMLGLGNPDKCVLISMIPKGFADVMLHKLRSELRLGTVNSGIAFTIPLTGVNSLIMRMLTKNTYDTMRHGAGKGEKTMTEAKYTLISAIVNRGFSGDVMDAARGVGAAGGTVIRSNRIGTEEVTEFWGLSVQEEKEIVLILAAAEDKVKIMRKISENCGMNSEAKGIVMSLPIDSVMGFHEGN